MSLYSTTLFPNYPSILQLHTSDAAYTRAWMPYWTEVAKIVAPQRITHGGPVIPVQIENEFDSGSTRAAYLVQLERVFRDNGIVVLTTHNIEGQRWHSYATGTGAVDIWGTCSVLVSS
jgi:hypothetical protein